MDSLERTPPSPVPSTCATVSAPEHVISSCCPTATFPPDIVRSWLRDRRVLAGAGLAVTGSGVALGWDWLTAVGVAPLIVSAVPCLLMCAFGLCMMGWGNQVRSPDVVPGEAATPTDRNGSAS
jgi:hypothetical protein